MSAAFALARSNAHKSRSCEMIVLIALLGCSSDRAGEEDSLKKQFPELASAVTDRDRAEASTEIGRTDRDRDGVVTEAEWIESKYQPVERFKRNDLNGDGVLTPFEHSLRWTQYRLDKEHAAQKKKMPARR